MAYCCYYYCSCLIFKYSSLACLLGLIGLVCYHFFYMFVQILHTCICDSLCNL